MAHPDIVSGSEGGRDSGGSRISLDIDPDAGNPDIQGDGHHDLELEDPSEDQGGFEDPQSNLDLEDEEGVDEEGQGEEETAEEDDERFAGLDVDDEDVQGLQASGDFNIELSNGKTFDLNKVKDLPAEVKKELRDGYLRNKDYTQKTQALQHEFTQWQETVSGASQIWENFNATKMRPDMLTQWFSPQELLMAVASTGLEVDPSLLPIGWKPGMPNYNAQVPNQQQWQQQQHQQPQGQRQAQPQQPNQNYDQQKFQYETQIRFALQEGLSGIKDKSVRKTVRDMALNIMANQQNFNPAAAIKEAKVRTKQMLGGMRGQKAKLSSKRHGRGRGGGGAMVTGGNKRPTTWGGADEAAMNRISTMK